MTDYWSKQKQLQEVYDRATTDSGVSWHEEYLKEKEKRIAIQYKYELLTHRLKELAREQVVQTWVDEFAEVPKEAWAESGKVYPAKDFGAGPIPVHHKMKQDEWDDERMDIIGQNGNTGDHYDEVEKEGM